MRGLTSIFFMILAVSWVVSKINWESIPQESLFQKEKDRTSITFLMGEDHETSSFFEKAELHFSMHPDEQTDLVVSSMRSLEDVIRYLNTYGNASRPWSTINLVLHGNPNTGLRTFITDGGHIATPKRLIQAVLLDDTPLLRNDLVDSGTQFNVWGCGIGKNPLVQIGLEQIFRTEGGQSIRVYCSPHFVVFREKAGGFVPERLKLSYWPYYFKRGYRPADWEIQRAMHKQFPEVDLDWKVDGSSSYSEDGLFQHTYHIPVSYTRIYERKEDRPDIQSSGQKMEWVRQQRSLMKQVEESDIPFDKFTWTVHKIIHTSEEGDRVPAIKAVGMSTVLCFLQLENPDDQ